jgi:type II secretory pathway predicted ATPase ExeA
MRDALVDFTPADPGTRSAFLTYEPYYGLKEKAFSLSADPRFLYKSRAHAPMFDELRAGIRRREGIIVLTGEPGTGKTTLCRGVLAALDRKTFCAFVPDPFVSREDLLKMLLIEFGVLSVEDVKSGRMQTATRLELSYPLYDFLRSLVPLQAYAVLIIDEAQNLSSKLLEEIRILSDLEGPEKLLQLVLVGQPELRDKLKDPAMRQVDQRISARCSLEPLGRDALPAYIAHRLTVAGGGADRVEFTPEALDLVYEASNGNPRLLNLIADKSLHRGHLDRTWTITPEIVTAALENLGYDAPAPPPSTALAPDLFLPEESLPEQPLPEVTDDGPHFLLEEARGRDVSDAPQDTRGRWRRTALLVTVGLALGALGVALNAWDLRRQLVLPLSLPTVAAPPPLAFSAGVAPVIPPAEFFASARP